MASKDRARTTLPSSSSSSASNGTDSEVEFHEALLQDAVRRSLKLDYLDTLSSEVGGCGGGGGGGEIRRGNGSGSGKGNCNGDGTGRFGGGGGTGDGGGGARRQFLHLFADLDDDLQHYDGMLQTAFPSERTPILPEAAIEANDEDRRDYLHKQVLFIIGLHLVLLCMVDFSLQIILVNCGSYCPSPALLYHAELAVVILFPCSVLLFLRLVGCCCNQCLNFVLLSTYSVMFSLFFFSVCDLLLGPSKAHRDIALILFTLTVSFILFSLYVYSKNSTMCLYLSLGILTLTVAMVLSLLLIFPLALNQLPQAIESVLSPNGAPKKTSLWMSYVMAVLFALASVSLTTLMFTALRGIIFKGNQPVNTSGPCSTAFSALLRIEMFFIVLPAEFIGSVCRRCLTRN